QYQYYCADITRTFPVNGKFNAEQKAIYDIVLAAHDAALAEIKPGAPCNIMSNAALRVIVQGLVDLKLLSGSIDEVIETEAYKPFYMHRIGHWLGMDTHDVGRYKIDNQWRAFEVGMLTTIEPGIYILPELDVEDRWKGIGVRIEDDILVTVDGPRVLSEELDSTLSAAILPLPQEGAM
ncbi:MAG: M24 family metallopeptidase, partial [Phycisphaerae bacterium]|nr:M24 family metallopeptidase [Phycisphaerae bacterium]